MMKKIILPLVTITALVLSSCSPVGHGAGNGALIGAGVGAIAAGDGNRARGAVIGGAVGAGAGAAIGAARSRHSCGSSLHFGHQRHCHNGSCHLH